MNVRFWPTAAIHLSVNNIITAICNLKYNGQILTGYAV